MSLQHIPCVQRPASGQLEIRPRQLELQARLQRARDEVTLLEQQLAQLQQLDRQRCRGDIGFPLPIAAG